MTTKLKRRVARALIKLLLRNQEFSNYNIRRPSVICNSIGGVASTALFNVINDRIPESTPSNFAPGTMPWKHTLFPPALAFIRKAVFVFGDPELAVLSIFRRNLCPVQLLNKGLPPVDFDLRTFIDNGSDLFRTREHLDNWTSPDVSYPVLCVRYNAFYEYRRKIVEFLDLSEDVVDVIPKPQPRHSTLETVEALGAPYFRRYRAIMKGAVKVYEGLDDFFVVT